MGEAAGALRGCGVIGALIAASSRKAEALRILARADKRLGVLAVELEAPKPLHRLVVTDVKARGILTLVRVAGLTFPIDHRGDIDVVRGLEVLGLGAQVDFGVVELEAAPGTLPGVVGQ